MTKSEEEFIKLGAITMVNTGVGIVLAGVFGPIAARALSSTLDPELQTAIAELMLFSILGAIILFVGSWLFLGELDRES
jgi:uncharacterized membrane protein YeaQ/YmgE (transglycosylase-associated protein family)